MTNSRSCPLLSLAASATMAISLADASGVGMSPETANPPSPSPIMTPLLLFILLNWLRAGWRMLNSTQAMAGIIGSKSARPRLSPSAISAICCAAMAASHELRAEKMAPARAVPASEADRGEFSDGFEEIFRPFVRLCMERREMGFARSEGNSSEDKRRKLPSLRNVILEVMSLHKVQLCMEPVLEPLIRRVVKEEVELALRKYLTSVKRNCGKEIQYSESRSLQLQFLPKISLPVFTGTRIEGEDCNTLKVALVDALTGQVVHSGPESSAKVEVVVLEGDFDGDEGGNWTLEEFKNNIVREREGKKPLLTGDAFLILKEGIGLVGEISFTDNSSWTRSRKFRLGARVVDNFDGVRVKDAKTESFIVRDHRGELYKKHHPPYLRDEVWRLEKIGKDGAFHKRLNRENVYTVKDFLILLFLDPTRLRNILGTGMSAKMWEVTIDHAQRCVLDPRLYFYCPPGSQQKTGVVFNVVGQVTGLLSECQYATVDKLSETEKVEAHNLVLAAFKHWEEVVSFDDEASLMDGSSHLFNNLLYSNSAMVETSDGCKVLTSQKISGFGYPQASACSPDIMPSIFSMAGVNSLDDFGLHNIDNMDLRYDQPLNFPGQVANSLICETESITPAFCEDEHLQYFDADCSLQSQNSSLESQADLHSAVSGFLLARSAAFAQRRWTMLFSVLKWFSIRRIVAKKTHVREKQRYC